MMMARAGRSASVCLAMLYNNIENEKSRRMYAILWDLIFA
jgi:hypothetical protein